MTTQTQTPVMTLETADAIIQNSPFADFVEETECSDLGVAYTLENGETILVNHAGQMLVYRTVFHPRAGLIELPYPIEDVETLLAPLA